MAKSITHAARRPARRRRSARRRRPAPVPASGRVRRARRRSPSQHLLEMRYGLSFVEDYVDADVSARDRDAVRAGARRPRRVRRGAARSRTRRARCGTTRRAPPTSSPGSSATPSAAAATAMRDVPRDAPVRPARHGRRRRRGSTRPARSSARRTSTPRPATSPASATCTCATASWDGRRLLPDGWVDHARDADSPPTPTTASRLRRALVAVAATSRARSPPTATRASTSSSPDARPRRRPPRQVDRRRPLPRARLAPRRDRALLPDARRRLTEAGDVSRTPGRCRPRRARRASAPRCPRASCRSSIRWLTV